MEALVAAPVLAWLALVVLAFAMAGLLRQVRDMRAVLARQQVGARAELPKSLRPHNGARYVAILLVDSNCAVCAEVAPFFAELAATAASDLDFVLLGHTTDAKWESRAGVRYVADSTACELLDPGWRPAVVVVDTAGQVVATEPAGSPEAVRAVVGTVAAAEPSRV